MSEKEKSQLTEPIKSPSKFSLKLKLFLIQARYYIKYPFVAGGYLSFCSTLIAGSLVLNAGIYLWKGPEHPINNFRWLLWKYNGKLPEDLKKKEEALYDFYRKQWAYKQEAVPQGEKHIMVPKRETTLTGL